MTEISRRSLLIGGGAVGATALLPANAQEQAPAPAPVDADHQQHAADAPDADIFRFFNAAEARWIEAAVDRLIPPDARWAGGKDAGVAIFIDRQLLGGYGRGERLFLDGPWQFGTPEQGYQLRLTPAELYRTALDALLADGTDSAGLADLAGEAQDALLKSLEAGERDLNGVPSAVFFETLLANTVEGFFADPAYGGNRDKAGWRMIGFPGAQAAYLGLYTQHGLRLDREPLGMDEVHHHGGHGD